MESLVSGVIPTSDRPQEAVAAARSAMAQTLGAIEVIVAVHGHSPETHEALRVLDDPRLKITELDEQQGPGAARNAGVDQARSEWVAFLDDDDRWDPRKLELQLSAARASPHRY